jgi:sodium/potassium-transporting ATPase subunit alpha
MDPEKQPVQRVRFGDQRNDEEFAEHAGFERRTRRRSSVGSLSIHSAGGARTVQPETALPITYRTLSIELDEGQHEKQKEVKKVKEKAAVGMCSTSLFHGARLWCMSSLFTDTCCVLRNRNAPQYIIY